MPKKEIQIAGMSFLPLDTPLPAGVGGDVGFTVEGDVAGFPSIGLKNGAFRLNRGTDEEIIGATMFMTFVAMWPHQQRVLFDGSYDAEEVQDIICASNDGITPLDDIEKPQAKKCATCPMSKPGSGDEDKIACRVKRNALVAVWLPDGPELFRMNISWATFGQKDDPSKGLYNVRSLGRLCKANNQAEDSLVLEATFDYAPTAAPSTVRFTPKAALDKNTYAQMIALKEEVDLDQVLEVRTFTSGGGAASDDDDAEHDGAEDVNQKVSATETAAAKKKKAAAEKRKATLAAKKKLAEERAAAAKAAAEAEAAAFADDDDDDDDPSDAINDALGDLDLDGLEVPDL